MCKVDCQCLSTPESYTLHLQELLETPSTDVGFICEGTRLGTRTQVLNNDDSSALPETLNKYGVFWTFATGEEVAQDWLFFAKNASGNREEFAKKVLHHVGFSDIDFSKRFHMVVFDLQLMDAIWTEQDNQQSFQALWSNIFDYLSGGFSVCHNSGAGYPNGTNISDEDDCYERIVEISEGAQKMIIDTNWHDLTGCPGGYPGILKMKDYESCIAECGDSQQAELYCTFKDILTPISYGGSIKCSDEYQLSKPDGFTTEHEAIWARVWFETCMACNPWFTGEGVGYDPSVNDKTGTEFYVRGDVDLELLGPASGIDLWP